MIWILLFIAFVFLIALAICKAAKKSDEIYADYEKKQR